MGGKSTLKLEVYGTHVHHICPKETETKTSYWNLGKITNSFGRFIIHIKKQSPFCIRTSPGDHNLPQAGSFQDHNPRDRFGCIMIVNLQ